jgi:hypothetical protein
MNGELPIGYLQSPDRRRKSVTGLPLTAGVASGLLLVSEVDAALRPLAAGRRRGAWCSCRSARPVPSKGIFNLFRRPITALRVRGLVRSLEIAPALNPLAASSRSSVSWSADQQVWPARCSVSFTPITLSGYSLKPYLLERACRRYTLRDDRPQRQ